MTIRGLGGDGVGLRCGEGTGRTPILRATVGLMNGLPDLSGVEKALPLVGPGLAKYCWLQAELQSRNVAVDPDYQRRFTGFYRVRRSAAWRSVFFSTLQERKGTRFSVSEALHLLARSTGRVEASFASKLVATIDTCLPVIDSIVLKNVGLRLPAASAKNRLAQVVQVHIRIAEWYREQLASAPGAEVVRLFRQAYPNHPVSDTKALDFVRWQIRGGT